MGGEGVQEAGARSSCVGGRGRRGQAEEREGVQCVSYGAGYTGGEL